MLRCLRRSTWSAAIQTAQKTLANEKYVDPISLIQTEMASLTGNIHALLGSRDSKLDEVAKYYVQDGKRVRPMLVLLIARSVPRVNPSQPDLQDTPLSKASVLSDVNPSLTLRQCTSQQLRLAEITEMIHSASLLHDDVIDDSTTRRGVLSASSKYSPKMAVLGGDFMLGRASVALARLRHPEVIELLATVLANLVEGEFMQLRNSIDQGYDETMSYYLRKTYLKTASLIAKSCRASAILGGAEDEHVEAAYEYGKNLGLAFQIVDDMLDYSASAEQLGKPSNADLKLGLATAPVLFAWRRHPELGQLIKRKFSHPGDVDLARKLALQSDGLQETRNLASEYCDKALRALYRLPESDSRSALEGITHQVLNRKK